MNNEHLRLSRGKDDWRKILDRVVRKVGINTGIDGEACADDQEGMAIRCAPCHKLWSYRAASAGAIVDDNALAPCAGEWLSNCTRNKIKTTTRGGRHDDSY